MIEKERLEELIKQGATIWGIDDEDDFIKIKTEFLHHPKLVSSGKYCNEWVVCYEKDYETRIFEVNWTYSNIFETEADAKWYLEFGNITREEKLVLPSWEDFNKKYKSKYSPVIAFNGKNPQCFYEMFFKKDDSKEGCVLIYDCDCKEYVYSNRLTKENYIDACRLCKKLFLGSYE